MINRVVIDDVDRAHAAYVQRLQALFEEHKATCAFEGAEAQLEIL